MTRQKEIYLGLPKVKADIFAFGLKYEILDEAQVFERIVRPWIAKKIMEYLGVEEEAMIHLVMKHVTNRNSA